MLDEESHVYIKFLHGINAAGLVNLVENIRRIVMYTKNGSPEIFSKAFDSHEMLRIRAGPLFYRYKAVNNNHS